MPPSVVDLTRDVRNVLPVTNGGAGGNVNAQTGTSYTIVSGDNRKLITFNNAAAVTVSLTSAATLGNLFICWVENLGAGAVTISTVDGGSLVLSQNQGASIWSDGTSFFSERGMGSGGGGAVPSATTKTITTASLATNASESGSTTIFKSFMLLKVQYSCKARVELYSTAAARDADASRAWGTIPTLYAQNELISDTQESAGAATWVMSPAALGFNADSTRTTTIYYRITNLDTAQAVTVTFTVLQMES